MEHQLRQKPRILRIRGGLSGVRHSEWGAHTDRGILKSELHRDSCGASAVSLSRATFAGIPHLRLGGVADKCRHGPVPIAAEFPRSNGSRRESPLLHPRSHSRQRTASSRSFNEASGSISEFLPEFDHRLRPIRDSTIIEGVRLHGVAVAARCAFDVHCGVVRTRDLELPAAPAAIPILQFDQHNVSPFRPDLKERSAQASAPPTLATCREHATGEICGAMAYR